MKYLLYVVLIYLLIMNIVAFAAMGIDKRKAVKQQWRIPEKKLFAFCIFGGCFGANAGMFLFRHKTKHWYFRIGFPLIMILEVALVIFLYVYFKNR